MPLSDFLGPVNEVLKQYHTINLQIKAGADATEVVQREVATLRADVAVLHTKVAALEESRHTLRAEMERIKAETIAELRAVKAETIADLKLQQMRSEADLYRKFVDIEAAVRQRPATDPTPQIEK